MRRRRAFRAARPRWQDQNGQRLGAVAWVNLVEKLSWPELGVSKHQALGVVTDLFDVRRRTVLIGRQIPIGSCLGSSLDCSDIGAPSASYADNGASSAPTGFRRKTAAKEGAPAAAKDARLRSMISSSCWSR